MILNNFYKDLMNSLYEGVYFVDKDKRIVYWNKAAEEMTGFKENEVLGKRCRDNILVHIGDNGDDICRTLGCPLAVPLETENKYQGQLYFKHKEGHRIPVEIRALPITEPDGRVTGVAEVFKDATPQSKFNEKIKELEQLSLIDPLTNLGNRRHAEIHLKAAFDEMVRYERNFGLLFIDIDHFKKINDTYGHSIGDDVLKMIAKTFLHNLRSSDFIGRWGGEEFIGIIMNVDKEQLYGIADKFRFLVEKSQLPSNSDIIKITISIGATLALDSDTIDSLIERADKLLYSSKNTGRNRVSID